MTLSREKTQLPIDLLTKHFQGTPIPKLSVTTRTFVYRVRPDLQLALDGIFSGPIQVIHFSGISKEHQFMGIDFGSIAMPTHSPAQISPPEYEAVDIGEEKPVECLNTGFWLLQEDKEPFALLMAPTSPHRSESAGVNFYLAYRQTPEGKVIAERFFRELEQLVARSKSFRGKVLSLEMNHGYTGQSAGIIVHRLAPVHRDELILPEETVKLLERNVLSFCRQRPELAKRGQSLKKGLLFYGPPGTGKTFTIRYLAGILPDHTTLLITAEQVGLLPEYMTLARLLQPSIVVIEDADLIARDRASMENVCEEVMLNKLLNEMDGLREDAEILFVLTTNRPQQLEAALAARPGRIDQAIEFPLPDAESRAKLVHVYARNMQISEEVLATIVNRTEGVSASFIKELMRRATQFWLERDGSDSQISVTDVNEALEEMLFKGGSLNVALLGGLRGK
jgi:energy-coupling factor transporter ATP-binding protein EcfA2